MMKQHTMKPLAILSTTLIALVAAATVAAVMAQSDATPTKVFPPNPWADKSDAERQADVDAAHKRNDEFLTAFVASKQDPRELPVLEVPSYAAPLPDLPSSVAAADLIVRGLVEDTTFQINASGGMPIALSTVRIGSVEKGIQNAVVTVRQLAGPVAQEDSGALVRLDSDPAILPGDEVILFLQRASDGHYTTQPGTGVYFVKDGRTYVEESNPFAAQVTGRTPDWLASVVDGLVD